MRKNLLAIGMISLFIGLAVLPLCSASTSLDDTQKNLGGERRFFVKAQVDGTVYRLDQGRFKVGLIASFLNYFKIPRLPIKISAKVADLTVTPAMGEPVTFNAESGLSIGIQFAQWETVDQIDDTMYYIKGTVYFCALRILEA